MSAIGGKQMAFPYRVGPDGRTALDSGDDHLRGLIEQVLFTQPGERVNRPGFGSGMLGLIFAAQDDELAHATQAQVQAALHQWLGELILVEAVDVASDDARLIVTVRYVVRRSRQRQSARFERGV